MKKLFLIIESFGLFLQLKWLYFIIWATGGHPRAYLIASYAWVILAWIIIVIFLLLAIGNT